VGTGAIPPEHGSDLALARALAGRVGDDERSVDGYNGQLRGIRGKEVHDLGIGAHRCGGQEPTCLVYDGQSRARPLPPRQVDASEHRR
jgi:hypothetical protein